MSLTLYNACLRANCLRMIVSKHQADHMLRDSVAILRQENSQLMVEINELKNDFGLREDQVRL